MNILDWISRHILIVLSTCAAFPIIYYYDLSNLRSEDKRQTVKRWKDFNNTHSKEEKQKLTKNDRKHINCQPVVIRFDRSKYFFVALSSLSGMMGAVLIWFGCLIKKFGIYRITIGPDRIKYDSFDFSIMERTGFHFLWAIYPLVTSIIFVVSIFFLVHALEKLIETRGIEMTETQTYNPSWKYTAYAVGLRLCFIVTVFLISIILERIHYERGLFMGGHFWSNTVTFIGAAIGTGSALVLIHFFLPPVKWHKWYKY